MGRTPLRAKRPRIAFVWAQFAPYHLDRIEAVANRLGERARVVGIEVASRSSTYAWKPVTRSNAGERRVLFPDRDADALGRSELVAALWRSLEDCDLVVLGLPSSDPAIAMLASGLRARGKSVWFCSDSKADDYTRRPLAEGAKRLLLKAYDGGIIAGPRSRDYYAQMGVPERRLLPGYDTVSTRRIEDLCAPYPPTSFAERPFLYLGRFVPKKNLFTLVRGFASYRKAGGTRQLVMAGSGAEEGRLRSFVREEGVADFVEWPGFLGPEESARELARCLALVLVSTEEQWGLVVNEACAAARPVIASAQVGASDLLIRNGETGFVLPDPATPEEIGNAMLSLGADEPEWESACRAAHERSWYGDAERTADTIELLIDHDAEPALSHRKRLLEAFR